MVLMARAGSRPLSASHPTEPFDAIRRRSAVGHEGQFPAPRPSARYRIDQETFAGTPGNERDAPEPDITSEVTGPLFPDLNKKFELGQIPDPRRVNSIPHAMWYVPEKYFCWHVPAR
jgi:hypothetical protein